MRHSIILFAALLAASPAFAAKSYQVTGTVLDLNDTTVVVEKGKEKWEIARAAAAIKGDLQKGAKVTVEYTMSATSIEVKGAAKAK